MGRVTATAHLRRLARPLRVAAFRRLWFAQLISELGDWAARLSLAVLVYTRTGSPALTGLVTAASLLPWLGPGQLMTGWSGRWPRRRVLITADLVRAGAFGLAALPLPIPLLLVVVFVAGLATPPFEAARSAIRPEIVPARLYPPAVALTSMTEDVTVAGGYVVGGGLVALLGPAGALVVNAGSFAFSAALLRKLPAAVAPRSDPGSNGLRRAAAALRADPLVARFVVLVHVAFLSATALTAMSAPIVLGSIGKGATTIGLLAALSSLVSVVATAMLPLSGTPERLLRRAGALMAIGGGGIVAGCALAALLPDVAVLPVAGAFAASGLLFTVIAPANVVVAPRLSADVRAPAFSLLMGMLVATEAAAAAGAGLAAGLAGMLWVSAALGLHLLFGGWSLLVPARTVSGSAAAGSGSAEGAAREAA